jgi:hypothetical protein
MEMSNQFYVGCPSPQEIAHSTQTADRGKPKCGEEENIFHTQGTES